MRGFIELRRDPDGYRVWVRISAIVAIVPSPDGHTLVHFGGAGWAIHVKEPPERVAFLISEARSWRNLWRTR